MNAAMPTPNNPDIAGCSGCLRAIRQMAMATPAASAAMSAACSAATMLTTTNTATGIVEATIPGTPPICSKSVGARRAAGGDSSGGPAVTGLLRGVGLTDLVERVVDHLASLANRQPPAHPQGAPGLDARDAATAHPDEGDALGAVEQLGLERSVSALRAELNAAQPTEHRDVLAAGT